MSDDQVRVRFAPSPTGYLHIGGVRTALFNWLFARNRGGRFILRIEDTDEVRSTVESVAAIVDSLRWLGMGWDEGPERGGEASASGPGGDPGYGPYYQMQRKEIYGEFVEQLLQEGKAYPCYCSKEELDAARKKAQEEKRPVIYDRRCRDLSDRQRGELEAQGKKPSIRFKMALEGTTVVSDLIRGNVSFDNSLLQDLVIQKTAGGPTYNFACVVDDHLMDITHVIRGDEHLSNTPSQVQLYSALGWEPPPFAHLSMILGPDGTKLSKRHGATSVLEYKKQGFLPETMRNYLALLGWSTTDSQQLFDERELAEKFDLAGCQKNPATFDPVKLKWMNGEHIRRRTPERLLEDAMPFMREAGLGDVPRERLLPAVALEREKCELLSEFPGRVDFFFKDVEYRQKAVDKVLKKDGVGVLLDEIREAVGKIEPFTEKALEEGIRAFCAQKDLKAGKVFHPIRVAVSGRTEGPTLFGMLELLGKEKVLERLCAARSLL
ncbi:MAG: glutamate--tRNA ligase [Elusimicrobiota bacterium]